MAESLNIFGIVSKPLSSFFLCTDPIVVVFGKDAVHCPDMSNCYCKLFGICGLSCNHENCEGQWHFPPGLALPEGWPKVGWNGEERNFTGPL